MVNVTVEDKVRTIEQINISRGMNKLQGCTGLKINIMFYRYLRFLYSIPE